MAASCVWTAEGGLRPPDYTPVTVSGVLETYQDGDYSYTHLVDAQMVVD